MVIEINKPAIKPKAKFFDTSGLKTLSDILGELINFREYLLVQFPFPFSVCIRYVC